MLSIRFRAPLRSLPSSQGQVRRQWTDGMVTVQVFKVVSRVWECVDWYE